MRRASIGRRPLPDFLIVGAQKAGTTSLHDYLCQHSRVVPPATKEVNYFDLEFHRGTNWYRAHFQRTGSAPTLTGEATPYYLFHPLVPQRVAGVLPACRLIVILRNPIDRAFSHHNHERALGFESLPFEQAIAAEAQRLDGEEARLLSEPRYHSAAYRHHSYVSRGRYAEQLERWLRYVDRDRLLVLSAEELFADPAKVVAEAQEFLGLRQEIPADVSPKNARAYAPISDEVKAGLRETFAPHNERLYRLVGRDFGWS